MLLVSILCVLHQDGGRFGWLYRVYQALVVSHCRLRRLQGEKRKKAGDNFQSKNMVKLNIMGEIASASYLGQDPLIGHSTCGHPTLKMLLTHLDRRSFNFKKEASQREVQDCILVFGQQGLPEMAAERLRITIVKKNWL